MLCQKSFAIPVTVTVRLSTSKIYTVNRQALLKKTSNTDGKNVVILSDSGRLHQEQWRHGSLPAAQQAGSCSCMGAGGREMGSRKQTGSRTGMIRCPTRREQARQQSERGGRGDAHDSPVSPSPAPKARGANICASRGAAPQQAGGLLFSS